MMIAQTGQIVEIGEAEIGEDTNLNKRAERKKKPCVGKRFNLPGNNAAGVEGTGKNRHSSERRDFGG